MSVKFCESFNFDTTTDSFITKNIIVSPDSTFTINKNLSANFTESTILLPPSDKIFIGSSGETLATNINNGSVPQGVIMMWSGTIVPAGWALCNGQTVNGMVTPNLSGRFVIGTSSVYILNSIGGIKSYTLSDANIPSHSHTIQNTNENTHTHGYSGRKGGDSGQFTGAYHERTGNPLDDRTTGLASDGFVNHKHSYTTPYENGATTARTSVTPIDILPHYYVLSYIMKT